MLASRSHTADVIIVGGGVIGSASAWQLRRDGFTGRIVVVERDPQHTKTSAALAMGGIRQQFCTAVTVQMVQHSVQLWKRFDQTLAVPGHQPHAWFRQRGYLFLADRESTDRLSERYEQQRAAGADVRRLTRGQIEPLIPDVCLDDIEFGVFGPSDGYANPREVLLGFRHGAHAAGAEYLDDEVVGVEVTAGRASGVQLRSGARLDAPWVINAAGAWGGRLARLADLDLPIEPVPQMLFRATLPRRWPYRFPMVVDPCGLHWRHDDPVGERVEDRIVVAWTRLGQSSSDDFSADETRWEHEIYPALVRRLPALQDVTDATGWTGMYEMTPDHNPLLGEHPALPGMLFACGFSGHGLMMSPATATIVSEHVRLGGSETFDVSIFAPDRFERGALVHDAATI